MSPLTKKQKDDLFNQKLFECCTCENIQLIENFSKNKSKAFGINSECKECSKITFKKWYEEYKEKKLNYGKQRYEDYPWKDSILGARRRCEKESFVGYKFYGAKRIKFFKSMKQEGEYLWISMWRNQDFIIKQSKKYFNISLILGDFLKRAIHRYDSNGHYEWDNCTFIPEKIHKKLEKLSIEEQKKILYKVEEFKDKVSGKEDK